MSEQAIDVGYADSSKHQTQRGYRFWIKRLRLGRISAHILLLTGALSDDHSISLDVVDIVKKRPTGLHFPADLDSGSDCVGKLRYGLERTTLRPLLHQ